MSKKSRKRLFKSSVLINKLVEFGHSICSSNQLFFKNLLGPTQCSYYGYDYTLKELMFNQRRYNCLLNVKSMMHIAKTCQMRFQSSLGFSNGKFCSPVDMWQCLETFLLSQLGRGELLESSGQRPGMLLNVLQWHLTALTTRISLLLKVHSDTVEKPWSRVMGGTDRAWRFGNHCGSHIAEQLLSGW